MPPDLKPFFKTAWERNMIRLRRRDGAKHLGHWTDDPVFREYRFCNVYREFDKTTEWFRNHIRVPLEHNEEKVLLATVAFRWFNRIETGIALRQMLVEGEWNSKLAKERILEERGKGPYVTGSYIIKTPDGMNKLDGVLWCIDNVAIAAPSLARAIGGKTLEEAHDLLSTFPYLGDFMAYEVVTDLRWTQLLWSAADIDRWANPGPGCARGLGRLFYNDKDKFNRGSNKDRREMLTLMRVLLELAHDEMYWPAPNLDWPRWEMREVEHWLCEFDKYERVRLGEGTPRQKFKG